MIKAVIGVTYLIYLQASLSAEPNLVQVPPPYNHSEPSHNHEVDLAIVDRHLNPPENVRFIVTIDAISAPLQAGDFIGYFDADTPNGIADYPNGISILGGRDADFFERAYDAENKVIGMQARESLSSEIAEELRGINAIKHRTFEVKVAVRDS